MDKEKLEKELKEINEKLKLKRIQIQNSPEYQLLKTTQTDLWKERLELETKLRNLKKQIYKKYVHNPLSNWGIGFKIKDIKSSVKQGIKTGLGMTSVNFIDKYDLKKIVKQLIDRDLEKIKTQTDKLSGEVKDIDRQITKYSNEQNK